MKIVINPAKLTQLEQSAMEAGVVIARDRCPVDTSSLQESIRTENLTINPGRITCDLVAGGEDYTGVVMVRTGKLGRDVDYADKQEAKHGFIVGAVPAIVSDFVA
jgi:hypothetical protein